MKNRSRKTILADLQADAGNTPVKGSDIERSNTRLSRDEIISGLRSMAQGGEKTRSAINDAYQARTAQRKNLRAERYNNLVKDYQALFDENKKLRTDKADLKTVAGLLSRADALYKERTSETENSLKAMQESLRSIQAGNMVSWVLPDSWERVIQYAEERTSGNQSSTSDILRDRPDQMSKWAQMEANAYQQKLDAYRETDYDWTDNQSRETYRSTVQKLQDKIDEANEKRDLARSVDSNLRAAEIQARIAENPANFMRWARMEADAYQKKLDETEYDWTDNQSREAYNALNQQWHDKIDAANALHDYAQATMLEQEAAAYTGEITAPQNPGKLYRQVNDKTRWASNQTRQQQPEGNRGADSPDAFMSETQRNTFNYLAGVKGEDAAEAYYELIKPQLEAARSANTAEEWEAITKEHPYLATVSSVLMTPLKIPAGLASVAKSSFGVELNQNDSMHQVVHAQNAIRQTAPEVTNWTGDATIFGQDADAFLYGTITSALDSALNMAIAGAITGAAGAAVGGFTAEQATSITSNLVSALMGAEMLPDTIMQEKAKGRSDSEAVALGIIRSTVEGITEKYSVEAFLGDPRGVAKRLEKAFVAEGSEEVASNWLNRIVDIAVKDPDNLKAQYDRLKESGASSGDALTQVIFGAMEEDAGSFLAGGISGLAMGGAAELVDYNRRISAEEYSRLVEAAQLPGAPENTAAEPEVQAEKPAEAPAEAAVEEKPAAAVTVREQRTVETGEAAEETTVEATEQENPVTLDEASKKYGAQAGAMVHTYQPGQDVAAYDRAYEIAYEMGRNFVNRSYAMQSGSTAYLTETQRELAYEAGQAAGRQNLKESGMTRMGNGTVTMQGGAKDARLNARQKASVQFLRYLAKITGIDFVVYQSEADGNGNLQGANGYYRNGTVHVDLNAGAMKEGELERAAMLRTVSHEMTHYIAETAPKEYQALQTFLLDKLSGMQDGSLEDLTERKLARAKAAGHSISYEQALEEVVADGCEMMLRDSEAVRTLAKENRGLFETVKDWLAKFLDNLRKAFSGVDAAHQESRYLMENYAKELQELWDAGLTEAVQNTKKAETAQKKAAQEGGDVRLSLEDERAFKTYQNEINTVIDQAIRGKGLINGKIEVRRIAPAGPKLVAMVAAASENEIDLSGKSIALNSGDVWHEYKRHTSQNDEVSRGQIAFTKRQFQNAVKCIIDPDVVECIFKDANNPTQRQSFAYAKQTVRGHYVVVEAVGGKRNPNISPVMILQFSKTKWESMIKSGKTLGEVLFENSEKNLKSLDVESNKKSRVTAAQFASFEAIANTPRSSQLNSSVAQGQAESQEAEPAKNSERDYSYEALTSKPDMNVTLVDDTAPKNRADVVAQAKKNAAKVGRFDPKTGSVSVHVNDIDTDVVLATNGLKHSLDRRLGVNAAVVVNAGEIIQNSIRINEMTAQKNEAESSYLLIGAARNENGDMYIVRSVVNRFSNELTSLDVLYAINAKKELAALNAPRLGATPLSETNSFNGNQAGDYPQGSRSDDRFLTGSVEPAALNAPGVSTPRYQSTISISKLLDYVNRYFPDILPESVLRHYGHDARPEGKLGESALYQERDADITDADILEHATLRAAENDWEREALREYQRTLGDAQNIQQEWDRQTELAETAKDRSAAAKARNRADIRQRQYERAQDRLRKLQEGAALQAFLRREQAYVQGRQDYETAAERQPGRYSDRFEERLDRGYQVSREVAERYAALNQTYGSIESGENPVRDIEVPRRTGKDNRVSQTVRTAMEAGATNEETVGALMEAVTEGNFSYLPITDKKAKAWAEEYIQERTWEEAAGDLQKTMGKGRLGKKDVALGFHLYNHYVQEGQTKEAVRLLVDLSERIREGAQAMQAVRMLKQLSPDHQVYALTQSIHSLQKELDSRYGDKAPKLRMDDVLVRNYLEAEGDEAVEAARKALYQSIANQLPNTWVDKWNSWRYLAMLSSPRTHIRNIFGNAGFVAIRKTKDIVASLMEHGYEAVTGKQGERTKVMFHDKALLEAARADYPNVVDLLDGAGKYSQAIGEIEEMKPAFGDKGAGWKALSKAADFNTRLLTVEDRWFSKPAYIGALAGYLQAKGITAEQFQTDEAIQAEARGYAVKEAQRATYRDFNDFSDFIASIGRRTHGNATMNKVEKTVGVLMEGVLPFRRTPANILVRAVDYSPIGLLRGVKQACVDVRAGEKTAAEAIDLLASGLTGTALLGFGALLCYAGLLTPPEDPDEKQAGFDDLQGKQAYSLHIGDRYYTVDWLAPEALPVFVGAEIGAYFKDRGERNGTALDAILRISEPMLEMSMLSSLNDLLDNLSYSDNKLLTILSSATFSYLTQCLPTVFGQAERVGETERETTFINRDSRLNGDLQYILANAANKAPGLEYQQIPYIDAWGRHEDTGNVAARVFNNLFNPAYVSEEQVEPFEAELQRLYNLGYTEVLPQRVPQSTKVSGNNLTADQYVTYAETKGAVQHDAIRDIVGSDWYSGMSDAVRDELISKAYDYAAASAKLAVDGNADVPQWVLDTMDAVKSGEELAGLLRERVDEGAVDFRTEYPEFSDLSNSAIGKYTEFCEGAGISARQFYDAYGACSEFTADKDENGESISGSKKQKVVDYILGLGLSREQERALWNAVKDKTWVDKDTPWA